MSEKLFFFIYAPIFLTDYGCCSEFQAQLEDANYWLLLWNVFMTINREYFNNNVVYEKSFGDNSSCEIILTPLKVSLPTEIAHKSIYCY